MTDPRSKPKSSDSEANGGITRALRVLTVIAEARSGLRLSDIAAKADLPVSSAHRFVNLLAGLGMLSFDPIRKVYEPGAQAYRLSDSILQNRRVNDIAKPIMQRLADATGETCRLALWNEKADTLLFIEQVHGSDPLQFSLPLYESMPMIWGCTGRAVLAHCPAEVVASRLRADGASPREKLAPPSLPVFETELQQIRDCGWAVSFGERFANGYGLAAPFWVGPNVGGAITLTIPIPRWNDGDETRYGPILADTAAQISEALGSPVARRPRDVS